MCLWVIIDGIKQCPTLFNGIIVKLDWERWNPLAIPSALSLPVSRILRLGWESIITLWTIWMAIQPSPKGGICRSSPYPEGMWRITMHETTPELDISTKISQLEAALVSIKTRLHQVQQGEERYSQLQTASHALKRQLEKYPQDITLQSEIERVQWEMEELAVILESRLVRHSSWYTLYWRAVRYGGAGMLIGWFLRSYGG